MALPDRKKHVIYSCKVGKKIVRKCTRNLLKTMFIKNIMKNWRVKQTSRGKSLTEEKSREESFLLQLFL